MKFIFYKFCGSWLEISKKQYFGGGKRKNGPTFLSIIPFLIG